MPEWHALVRVTLEYDVDILADDEKDAIKQIENMSDDHLKKNFTLTDESLDYDDLECTAGCDEEVEDENED